MRLITLAGSNSTSPAEAGTACAPRSRQRGSWAMSASGTRWCETENSSIEGNRIIHVGPPLRGPRSTDDRRHGQAGRPGVHRYPCPPGHRASHRLITDAGRPMFYGQPFLEITWRRKVRWPRRRALYQARRGRPRRRALELNAAFTVAELIRNGVTTFVELGGQVGAGLARPGDALWSRAYLARIRFRSLGRR